MAWEGGRAALPGNGGGWCPLSRVSWRSESGILEWQSAGVGGGWGVKGAALETLGRDLLPGSEHLPGQGHGGDRQVKARKLGSQSGGSDPAEPNKTRLAVQGGRGVGGRLVGVLKP